MRIVFIITDLEPGGAEKCLTDLVLRLDRQQFSPVVLVLQSPPPATRAKLHTQPVAAGVPVHYLNARSVWQTPWVLCKLWWLLRREQPNVVQTFLYHANVLGTVAACWAGVPANFVGVRVAEPKRFRRWVEGWVYRFARGLIFVSESVQSGYSKTLRPGNLFVIPNGIELPIVENIAAADLTDVDIPSSTPVLLVAGRLHTQKGLDWLIDSLPDIFAQLPHTLVIAGDGPERARLDQQARTLGLTHRLKFLGWRADVPTLLKRADCLLLPSRYEGMPNVLLEAMATGTPVIATRAEGVEELLGTHAAALTVASGDSAEWVKKIVAICQQTEQRHALVEELQARAKQHFSAAVVAQRYTEIWRSGS